MTYKPTFKSNIDLKISQLNNMKSKMGREIISDTMAHALDIVGSVAVGDFMKTANRNAPVDSNVLTMRTGRLARSLTRGQDFSGGSGVNEAIRKVVLIKNGVVGIIGTKTPYAEIHEKGGNVPITRKSRNFFWAMYAKTNEDKWKAMALSTKRSFHIPARPFLGHQTAVQKSKSTISDLFETTMAQFMLKYGRNI